MLRLSSHPIHSTGVSASTNNRVFVKIIPRKHKMSKRARQIESNQRVTGYPQKTAETRPG